MTKPPFQPLGADHIVLWVGDLPAAVKWYTRVLGCTPAISYPEIAMEHLWCGALIIGLWDATAPEAAYARTKTPPGTNMDHLAIAIGPYAPEALRAHLAHHSVPIEKELHQTGARGYGHSTYIHDPWGNRLELKGPTLFDRPPRP
ncbi:MAG: VOC family protein [Shimia sp.]